MRDFRFGSHTGFDLGHYETSRQSDLPIGYFDEAPWWRHVQRALIVALVVIAFLITVWR